MKKILLRDRISFNTWQQETGRLLSDENQIAVSLMPLPMCYPVMLVWIVYETKDIKFGNIDTIEHFQYFYVYPGSFPHKKIKTGTYIYQITKTDEMFSRFLT